MLKSKFQTSKFFSLLAFAAVISLSVVSPSSAQTTNGQVIITWEANNYIPAGFTGKPLPAPHTEIVVSAELIQNNKLMDVSGAEIRWFVDDEFLKSGTGLKTISFYAGQEDDGYASVRATIVTKDGSFQNSLQIPIVSPEVVLSYKSPTGAVAPDSQITVEAIPFSFSIRSLSDLSFFWSVNEGRVDTKGNVLTLNVGTPKTISQNTVQISAATQNNLNPLEIAKSLLFIPLQTSQ